MATEAATILLVEDEPVQRELLSGFLRKLGYTVVEADGAEAARKQAEMTPPHLLVTDLRLGGPDGVSLLESLKERQPDLQAIVLTAFGTLEDAVRAMKAGAYDFVSKPVDLDHLEVLVEKALAHVQLAVENRGLREVVETQGTLRELIGESEPMRRVKELALKVAPSRASLLLLGESGSGKEVLARAIHLASPRRVERFVVVNCAALSETLIESELFGHEKGAFTGAAAAKPGRFELADGGTLFLDEVGDIPLPVQVKLLNVLQTGHFERVGGTETRSVDVRVIAATHRDLEERIQQGSFREDLYYRLNVVAITLPPLHGRPGDVPLLVDHFLRKHADLAGRPVEGVDARVLEQLSRFSFRGNVRQLENWIERAVVLAEGPTLTAEDFPPQLAAPEVGGGDIERGGAPATEGDLDRGLEEQVAELETAILKAALAQQGGNKSAVARQLKVSERTIRYKVAKYGIAE